MLTVQEIKTFIDNDAASMKKQLAKTGLRYYEGDHDIKNYRIFFVDANGNLQEDKYKSNIKICHSFSLNWWIRKYSSCFLARMAL